MKVGRRPLHNNRRGRAISRMIQRRHVRDEAVFAAEARRKGLRIKRLIAASRAGNLNPQLVTKLIYHWWPTLAPKTKEGRA